MSLPILLAVLGSALLHALWNALIKTGTSRLGATVILSLGEVPIGVVVALFSKAPTWQVMPWVIASGCTHFIYKFFLTYAYARGDLSRVYPLARGTAPLIVGVISTGFLAEPLRTDQLALLLARVVHAEAGLAGLAVPLRRNADMLPALDVLKDVSADVALVQSLHDGHHRIGLRVVQSC